VCCTLTHNRTSLANCFHQLWVSVQENSCSSQGNSSSLCSCLPLRLLAARLFMWATCLHQLGVSVREKSCSSQLQQPFLVPSLVAACHSVTAGNHPRLRTITTTAARTRWNIHHPPTRNSSSPRLSWSKSPSGCTWDLALTWVRSFSLRLGLNLDDS